MPHKAGKKFASSHSTIIEAAAPIIKLLEKQPHVTKIVLGIIKPRLSPAPHRLKITETENGFKLQVRGTNSLQHLFVYTKNPSEVLKALRSEIPIPIILG